MLVTKMPLFYVTTIALATLIALPGSRSAYLPSQDLVPQSTQEVALGDWPNPTELEKRGAKVSRLGWITFGVALLTTEALLAGYTMSTTCANAKGEDSSSGWHIGCAASVFLVQVERILYLCFGILAILKGAFGTGDAQRTDGEDGTEGTPDEGMDTDHKRLTAIQRLRNQILTYEKSLNDEELGMEGKKTTRRSNALPSLLEENACDGKDDSDSCVPHRVWADPPRPKVRRDGAAEFIHGIHHTPLDFDFHEPSLYRRGDNDTVDPVEDLDDEFDFECVDDYSPKANQGLFSGTVFRMNVNSLKDVDIPKKTLEIGQTKEALGNASRAMLPHMPQKMKDGEADMFCTDLFVKDTEDNLHWVAMAYNYQSTDSDHPYRHDEAFLKSCGKGV